MRKMITCSFDDMGVVMTAWNGVHPDRPGHFSVTKTMSREVFNDACKHREKFSEILGTDICLGWQNALSDAVKNASNLKIDMVEYAKFATEMLAAYHGDKAAEVFAEMEKNNTDIQAAVNEHLQAKLEEAMKKNEEGAKDGGPDTTADTGKGGKKSRRKADTGTPADAGASDAA